MLKMITAGEGVRLTAAKTTAAIRITPPAISHSVRRRFIGSAPPAASGASVLVGMTPKVVSAL